MDLSIYASFGSLTSLYGRFHYYGDRLRMQLGAGLVFISVMLIGTLLAIFDAQITVRIMVVALIATLVTGIAIGFRWHPGGATFAVFAAGAVATIPATWINFAQVLIVASSAVLFSLALTATLGLLRTRSFAKVFRPLNKAVFQGAWSVPVTVGVGALLAGLIGQTFDNDHWYWAMVAASVVLAGAATTHRITRSMQRFTGTTLGVLVAALFLSLEMPTLALIAVIIVLQAAAELLIGRNYGVAMLVVTPLALLMISLANPIDPSVLVADRVFETFIGSLVGTVIAFVSARMRTERVDDA
ncbi:FUSC family protein [Enteractinococcus helveticum]|nr:FUSC family protein [Enteractinococcus helveticum]